jgi:hypothetical protein
MFSPVAIPTTDVAISMIVSAFFTTTVTGCAWPTKRNTSVPVAAPAVKFQLDPPIHATDLRPVLARRRGLRGPQTGAVGTMQRRIAPLERTSAIWVNQPQRGSMSGGRGHLGRLLRFGIWTSSRYLCPGY